VSKKVSVANVLWKYINEKFQTRALPDFIIIGAQKSGTSSLYSYLAQHPQLKSSTSKEVHYFDGGLSPEEDNFKKGEAWYRSHFPFKKDLAANQKTFEASPLYIFNPLVPARMFELIPKVKIIVVLRNPTERAISQYFHEKRLNMETMPIFEALQEEENRLEHVIKNKDFKSHNFVHSTYKSRGMYKGQIERYFNYFPREQILIINSDDLFTNTADTLRQIFKFVGVDTKYKVENLQPRNVSSNRTKVEPHVYEYLNSYFQPYNEALYKFLGKNYKW
jgi:hypothetical protein